MAFLVRLLILEPTSVRWHLMRTSMRRLVKSPMNNSFPFYTLMLEEAPRLSSYALLWPCSSPIWRLRLDWLMRLPGKRNACLLIRLPLLEVIVLWLRYALVNLNFKLYRLSTRLKILLKLYTWSWRMLTWRDVRLTKMRRKTSRASSVWVTDAQRRNHGRLTGNRSTFLTVRTTWIDVNCTRLERLFPCLVSWRALKWSARLCTLTLLNYTLLYPLLDW